jgi:hypothetical protein
MQFPAGVVHVIALAQRIQTIALAGMHLAGKRQRIQHGAPVLHAHLATCQLQFVINKTDVKISVVNNKFGAVYKLQEFLENFAESWLIGEHLAGYSMYLLGPRVDIALRIYIYVEATLAAPPVDQFYTTDLNNSVTFLDLQARGLGIQNNLTHKT